MTALQNLTALVHLQSCKALASLGVAGQYTFTHLPGGADETAVSLWMIPLQSQETYDDYQNTKTSTESQSFEWAIQTGFAGGPGSVAKGDFITVGDQDFVVDVINNDQVGAVYKVDCLARSVRVL